MLWLIGTADVESLLAWKRLDTGVEKRVGLSAKRYFKNQVHQQHFRKQLRGLYAQLLRVLAVLQPEQE